MSPSDGENPSGPQNHPTLYFPTGDIIIRAKLDASGPNPRPVKLFRVHSFLLAHHSPVLADMLALSTPSSLNESLDGVPVAAFPDDPTDVESLLLAFYNPEYVSQQVSL